LIRALKLPLDFGLKLNEYVRGKYQELWRAIEESKGQDQE
jgi:hypothetical protein